MKLRKLTSLARVRADDLADPPFATDVEYAQWASEGQDEAAIRSRLLYDDRSAFLSIPLVANKTSYALDPRIWRIDSVSALASGATTAYPIELTGIDRLREPSPHRRGWPACGGSWLRCAHVGSTLRVDPKPTTSGAYTLKLSVYRRPLCALKRPEDEPEIDEEDHEGLVDWMVYRACSTDDPETNDPSIASQALAAFERRFGTRDSADTMRRHNERRRVSAPYPAGY